MLMCKADCGIMVTASHNPKEDNGYKVYWGNGSQVYIDHTGGIVMMTIGETCSNLWELGHMYRGFEY